MSASSTPPLSNNLRIWMQAYYGEDPTSTSSTRDARCQTVPQPVTDDSERSIVNGQDKDLPESQASSTKDNVWWYCFLRGPSGSIRLNHSEEEGGKEPANMAEAAKHSIAYAQPHHRADNDPVVDKEGTSSEESSTDSGSVPPPTKILHPLVLTALPHVPIFPADDDSNTPEPTASTEHEPLTNHMKSLLPYSRPAMRPTARRQGSQRVPPPTPPEAIKEDRLSMPTLPSLHRNSRQELIERYRLEHRFKPDEFEARTKKIKSDLIRLKVARGGECFLHENEYTAELASRLDAAAIEAMSAVRLHDDDDVHVESEDDGDHDKEGDITRFDKPRAGVITRSYKDWSKIDRARLLKAPSVLEHDSQLTIETFADSSERRTYERTIKVTQIVSIPSTRSFEPLVDGGDREDDVVSDVAELLRVMAAQVGDL